MKWLWITLALLMPGGLVIYAFGMWYAGMTPRSWWRGIVGGTVRHTHEMSTYEQWAEQMEQARQVQAQEDKIEGA